MDERKYYANRNTTTQSADRNEYGVFSSFRDHACHVPVVEVDIETGAVTFLHYAAVHDCGTLVNPRSLAGHIVGGTAHAIATALHDEDAYDADGHRPPPSCPDDLIPAAVGVPEPTA